MRPGLWLSVCQLINQGNPRHRYELRRKTLLRQFLLQSTEKSALQSVLYYLFKNNWPHPILDLRWEFVAATKKEIASQSRLPERWRPQLCYGYLSGRLRDTSENYRNPSLYHYQSQWDYWSNSQPLQNEYGQVLGYYKYTLVKQPGESSGSCGKLFWLMVFGTAVWFWFFR